MGPVSFTVIHFERSKGSHAHQLATPIVYEAGLMIYAEHGETLLEWSGRELIADLPSNWDEIRFLDGMPGSHISLARRSGDDWYIDGMTASPRTADLELNFLDEGRAYEMLLFSDQTHDTMAREKRDFESALITSGWLPARVSLRAASSCVTTIRPVWAQKAPLVPPATLSAVGQLVQ